MILIKIWWLIKSLRYKFYFRYFGWMSYIGSAICIIRKGTISIGNNVHILPGLRMETVSHESSIIIGNNCSIGQNFHIVSGGKLIIEDNVTISGNVLITNLDHQYDKIGVHILKQPHIVKNTVIGDNCFIGYGAVIQAGTQLGKQCIVGANAVVKGKFPDNCVIAGVPAKVVKKYNVDTNLWEKIVK